MKGQSPLFPTVKVFVEEDQDRFDRIHKHAATDYKYFSFNEIITTYMKSPRLDRQVHSNRAWRRCLLPRTRGMTLENPWRSSR